MTIQRKRLVKSIKQELIKKSREAALAAVQVFNNPAITFKSEIYVVMMVIAWTYLLHAYYRGVKVDYRYFETLPSGRKKFHTTAKGAYKHWELERCLKDDGIKDQAISVEAADKMTDRQISAKVREHFST